MIVNVGECGQLGNRLFTFANLAAFAMEHHVALINPGFARYASSFPWFDNNSFYCEINANLPKLLRKQWIALVITKVLVKSLGVVKRTGMLPCVQIRDDQSLNIESDQTGIANAARNKILVTSGLYIMAPTAFNKHCDAIRKIFRPSDMIQRRVDDLINKKKANGNVIVGVHIRQGDYAEVKPDLTYSPMEIAEIMKKYSARKSGQIKYIICSNGDIPAAIMDKYDAQRGPGGAVEDLYTLARCDRIISAASTFAQWASFYGSVPRYSINYKCEKKYGCPVTEPMEENFIVHKCGFGRFSNQADIQC